MSRAWLETEHRYGSLVHIIDHPFLTTLLNRLSRPETKQPEITQLVQRLYEHLLAFSMAQILPRKRIRVATRMTAAHPEQVLDQEILDQNARVICVSLARAGTLPSHICYQILNETLNPEGVRQDHIWASRLTDSQDRVKGTDLSGVKIGGDVDDSIVLFPDPMGATGGTIVSTIDLYKAKYKGQSAKYVALHLIITPEYIRAIQSKHPEVHVFALRLDRGLSSQKALAEIPGTFWPEERGLNEKQYIVPGAGGLGEILNNSFV